MSSFFKKLLATGAVFSMGLTSVAMADRVMDSACCPPPPCNPCGNWCDNFSFYGAWLYWKVNGDEFDYAVTKHRRTLEDSPTVLADEESIHNVRGSWDSGFRIGFAFEVPDCCWGVDLNWSHFNSSSTSHETSHDVTGDAVATVVGLPSVQRFYAALDGTGEEAFFKGSVSFHYNTVDLEFGRWLCCGNSCLVVRPHLGFRYADFNESFKNGVEFSGAVTEGDSVVAGASIAEFHAKNKFHGFGVRAGLDADLRLCDGWSVIGRSAFSLVSGRTHIKQTFAYGTTTVDPAYTGQIKENYRQKRAIADLAFGLRYKTLACNCYPVFIELAWEHHYLWNQHRFWVDDSYGSTLATTSGWKKNGDVAVQGLTLTLGLDF